MKPTSRCSTGIRRRYTMLDTNYNVTALVGTDGQVKGRFLYTSYGERTVLDANWTGTTDTYGFLYGHQGGRIDPATGLIHFQARDYNPTLGRWMQQDPAGYVDGMSLYQYVRGNPVSSIDPTGLRSAGIAPMHGIPGMPSIPGMAYGPNGSPIMHFSSVSSGSPFLPNPNQKPPGWNPSWPTGSDNRGPYVQDPNTGRKYYPSPEDSAHWPHYDYGNKQRYPKKCIKLKPNQKKPPYGDQNPTNPWDNIPKPKPQPQPRSKPPHVPWWKFWRWFPKGGIIGPFFPKFFLPQWPQPGGHRGIMASVPNASNGRQA